MLSLTAQWIEENFEMKRVVLHAQECPGSHTGAAIARAFESMLAQWNITKDMVHVVMRDNGRNMAKAMEDCGLNSLGCMAHTLQLAVHEGVLSQRSISDCLAIGRKIVGHFKHSQLAMSRLGEIQTVLGLSKKMLQQDTPTRWNSTFYMMSSLIAQKRALGAYGAEYELPALFSAYQWGLIENAVTLLAPFEELTREVSSHKATTSDVIPSVEALKRLLNKSLSTDSGVKTTKATLLEAVKQRFNSIYTEPLYVVATILDPRYKDCFFDQATKQRATEMLLRQLNKMTAPEDAEKETSETESPLKKRRTESDGGAKSLLDMYGEILEENTTKEHQTYEDTPVGQQVNAYLSEPPISRNESPLQFWKSNMSRFPALAQAARKYLSAPCTSVDSERLFSAASNVIDEKRNDFCLVASRQDNNLRKIGSEL
ncbi:zinc finger BED domain-containing protein 4-like [Siphateles boraxobius]|uniref:zinc finger BED domain-containing protein 4-like n=1 Tax=Siphateles boraxobius TaxID=180520 RepID=UPI004062C299